MNARNLSPAQLLIRCFAEKKQNQWQAFSLEFGLAAQADSLPEVKRKLESMIQAYVYDALVGEDRGHADELLNRAAPWFVYAKYYCILLLSHVAKAKEAVQFKEPVALEPRMCPV